MVCLQYGAIRTAYVAMCPLQRLNGHLKTTRKWKLITNSLYLRGQRRSDIPSFRFLETLSVFVGLQCSTEPDLKESGTLEANCVMQHSWSWKWFKKHLNSQFLINVMSEMMGWGWPSEGACWRSHKWHSRCWWSLPCWLHVHIHE